MRHIPSQQALVDPGQQTPSEHRSVTDHQSTEPIEKQTVFPYQAKIEGDDVPLLGHGGGTILRLTAKELRAATVDVLEEQNGKARVLCRGCSSSHPYQAGWISMDYIQPNN